jgi:hypothetical protein
MRQLLDWERAVLLLMRCAMAKSVMPWVIPGLNSGSGFESMHRCGRQADFQPGSQTANGYTHGLTDE